MKITAQQLRRIIREEVEKSLTESNAMPLKDGGVVNSDSGEILDMDSVPPQYLDHVEVDEMGYTTLPHDKFEELRGELKGLSAGKPKKQRLAPYQLNRESKGFDDYIRDVDRDMPTLQDSPDPQDVHDEFLLWRDRYGEVPIQKLADELGVHVNRIDFNGTGLRVINGVVTELLGDTPYRTDR
jgi:hypothetical protein